MTLKSNGPLEGLYQDLLRIGTRKLVTEPLAEALGGIFKGMSGGSGGGIGGFFSNLFGIFLGAGKAAGGAVHPFGIYPVNEKGQESLSSDPVSFVMQPRRSRLLPT